MGNLFSCFQVNGDEAQDYRPPSSSKNKKKEPNIEMGVQLDLERGAPPSEA